MPSKNKVIDILREMATLLELDGANSFRVNAYTKAARALESGEVNLAERVEQQTLTDIDGIGKGIAEKIEEYWREGRIAELDELHEKFPDGLVAMTAIPGFGAKKARAVYDELGIATIDDLEKACQEGALAPLKGFGAKTEQKILEGITQLRKHSGRFRLDTARRYSVPILEAIRSHKAVKAAETAGSLRRWRETVKDIDIVCATEKPNEVMDFFTSMEGVDSIIGKGETKASVRLENGMNADLRCVSPQQYPFALMHFTGSKEHNVRMRQRAIERDLKLNEYGLFPEGSDKSLQAESEEEIHKKLGLKQWIAPELREDMGEIDAASAGKLPPLIERSDLVGLLHMHTRYSDGTPTLAQYAEWAHDNGITWMGISDHSQAASYAGGLKPDEVRKQWKEIDQINKRFAKKKVRLLKGIEADILADGAIDYEEEVLAGFEFVIASVHSRFNLSEKEQTERVLAAVKNPYTTVLGHMTGRLILQREGYAIDQKAIIAACAEYGVIIEINANPRRLDLDWRLVRHALEQGCMIAISPDAHVMDGLEDVDYGLGIARKGWLSAEHCVNCWDAERFLRHAKRHL